MPKTEIDYSNTIIYKITCKDTNVKDVYVGHTTNFVQRKHAHKQGCVNKKSSNYKCKLYETIRTNGGWNNWSMEIINFFKCRDHYEARIKEQEYFVMLNANLNSIEPLPKPKEIIPENIFVTNNTQNNIVSRYKYTCVVCHYNTNNICQYNNHLLTTKHIKNENDNHKSQSSQSSQKSETKYVCTFCNYHTENHYDYNKHLQTSKHKNNEMNSKKSTISTSEKTYSCVCGSVYKYDSGYYRHKKNCNYVPETVQPPAIESQSTPNNQESDSQKPEPNWVEMMQMLMKENQEIRNFMVAQHNMIVEQNNKLDCIVNRVLTANNVTSGET